MMRRRYKTVIIDDNELAIRLLKQSLSLYPGFELVGTATNASMGETVLMEQRPDLLFLDIELPDKSGMEILKNEKYRLLWEMQIVMYSSHTALMLDSFRTNAFDFLNKAYTAEEFSLVMERFLTYKSKSTILTNHQTINPTVSRFRIATVNGFKIVELNEIGYFEYDSAKKQWKAVLPENKRLQLKYTTNADTILEYSHLFFKINQYQIINLHYLSEIGGQHCTLLPPFDNGDSFQVSRISMKTLKQNFCHL